MSADKPVAPEASPIHARGAIRDADHGRQVLEAFYALQPSLSSIARAITENEDVSVEPTAGGTYTDGKTIYMMLTPGMLVDSEHERMKCGKRNANGLMMCKACAKYESVVVPLYHEMGHIIFDSFEKVDDTWVNKFFREEVVADNRFNLPELRLKVIEKRLAGTGYKSYMELAPLISPFFPMLLNALEDSRVNAGVIRANPGARKMFRGDIAKVMEGGIETVSGTSKWSERPPNAQFIIGCLLAASSIYIEKGWLSDEIIEAMADPVLSGLLLDVSASPSVKEVFTLSVPILERARELGYLRHEDDEEKPEPDSGEGDGTPEYSEEGEADESEATGEGSSNVEDDDENDDPEEDDAEGEGDQEGDDEGDDEDDSEGSSSSADSEDEGEDEDEGDGDSDEEVDEPDANPDAKRDSTGMDGGDEPTDTDEYGDKGTPDEVAEDFDAFNPHEDKPDKDEVDETAQKALDQRTFEGPSHRVSGLDLRDPDHIYYREFFQHGPDPSIVADPQIIQKGLGPLRVAFTENKMTSFDRNKKSGRVNPRVLAKRVPFNDPRLFRKKRVPGERDYHVVIGLDVSGSTASGPGGYRGTTYLQMIKTCALLQAEMLSRVGVPFEVYAHTGGLYDRDEHGNTIYGPGIRLNIARLKSLREPFNDEVRTRIRALRSSAANLDGHTLEFYRQRLDESAATDKLIIYYTDGAMPAENYDEELKILKRECNTIRRKRYDVLAVGIANSDPQQYGLDTVRVDVPHDMQKVVTELERRLE